MTDPRYMGFFEFDGVDPERCREDYGGSMTDAEREAVLAYMAAATKDVAYMGLAPSRIEGTWGWWTEEDKRRNAAIRQAHEDWINPFRIQMPSFFEPSVVFNPYIPIYENMADDPDVRTAIDKILDNQKEATEKLSNEDVEKFFGSIKIGEQPEKQPATRQPGVNGGYDPVTLGACDMLTPDGKWIFPQMWDTHYIAKHGLTPDREFVKDAVAWRGQNAQQTD